jgi:hypothetical protein
MQMTLCPFGQPVGTRRDPQWCPLVSADFRSCHCLIEVLRHGLDDADDQSTHICAWWRDAHAWEYEWPERVMLPEFGEVRERERP